MDEDSDRTRIVFVGKTGNGKSSSINSLIGRNEFHAKASSASVTINCQKVEDHIQGKNCLIVDSPGLYDTKISQSEIFDKLKSVMDLTYPGVHVFVVVLTVTRFTEEEQKTVDFISDYFGDDIRKFGLILFTKLDDLEQDGVRLDDFIRENEKLQAFVKQFGRRYIGFNNRLDKNDERMQQTRNAFIDLVDKIIRNNNGRYYTTKVFETCQKAFDLKMKKIEEMNVSLEERAKQMEKMSKDHKEAMENIQKQHFAIIEKLHEEMKSNMDKNSREMAEMNKNHENEKKKMRAQTEERLAEIERLSNTKINYLTEEMKSNMDKNSREMAEMNKNHENEKKKMRAQMEEMLTENQRVFNTKINNLQEETQKELAKKNQEMTTTISNFEQRAAADREKARKALEKAEKEAKKNARKNNDRTENVQTVEKKPDKSVIEEVGELAGRVVSKIILGPLDKIL